MLPPQDPVLVIPQRFAGHPLVAVLLVRGRSLSAPGDSRLSEVQAGS